MNMVAVVDAPSVIIQTYYISTGKKNAMYTLRQRRDVVGQASFMGAFMPDFYLCTLAATEDKAVAKAKEYVDAMRDRIGETSGFKIIFDDSPDHENYKRRGKLSTRDTRNMETIEDGFFPFGKHVGTPICAAPESYVLFFADKAKSETDPVMCALSAACMGIALERGWIAKREVVRAERAAVDSLSNFIGKVGERRDFTGVVVTSFNKITEWDNYWINKIRVGDDLVSYMGCKSLGNQGEEITFRATIKEHKDYNGIKTTKVNRPA